MDRRAVELQLVGWYHSLEGFVAIAIAACQREERHIGCWKNVLAYLDTIIVGELICSRDTPFEDIQCEFRIVVSLIPSVAEMNNGSGRGMIERGDEEIRCGRCGRCGKDCSQQ